MSSSLDDGCQLAWMDKCQEVWIMVWIMDVRLSGYVSPLRGDQRVM